MRKMKLRRKQNFMYCLRIASSASCSRIIRVFVPTHPMRLIRFSHFLNDSRPCVCVCVCLCITFTCSQFSNAYDYYYVLWMILWNFWTLEPASEWIHRDDGSLDILFHGNHQNWDKWFQFFFLNFSTGEKYANKYVTLSRARSLSLYRCVTHSARIKRFGQLYVDFLFRVAVAAVVISLSFFRCCCAHKKNATTSRK